MTDPIVILAGGGDALPRRPLPHPRVVIAADSGLHLAAALGLRVDLVVGDLDSVRPEALADAITAGAQVEPHPPDKDSTDLHLALDAARRLGGGRVIVVGGDRGDRFDHLLAAAALLGSGRSADLDVEWWSGSARALVARGKVEVDGDAGDIVSIVPVGGPATVTATGVRWALDGDTLEHGSTRGVSNEITDPPAVVDVTQGAAFVIHQPSLPPKGGEPERSEGEGGR
jgi:thiamine pyrophosphokinase